MSIARRIRKAIRERRAAVSDHALEEIDDDSLTLADVRSVLSNGVLRERREDDPRGTRYVIRGVVDNQEVEVVCRFLASDILWVITVYVVKETE
jgi:hypothetical protein